jgi:predicted methyltransferase
MDEMSGLDHNQGRNPLEAESKMAANPCDSSTSHAPHAIGQSDEFAVPIRKPESS